MIRIRRGVFETNSSSTHSIIICSDDEYKRLTQHELLIGVYSDQLISKDDAIMKAKEYAPKYIDFEQMTDEQLFCYLRENDIAVKLEDYGEEMEHYTDTYTTKGGEKIVAFGYYGYDG